MIKFQSQQAIYLQIANFMSEKIISEQWLETERIPSVREVATMVQVNPNTVMRAFSHLQNQKVIHNKRGVGYFVSDDAKQKVKARLQQDFLAEQLPKVFYQASLLGLNAQQLAAYYSQFLRGEKK
jgi:DNA-binding transcriptional regulator YhcF (GntR family)